MSGAAFLAGISFPRALSGGGPRMSMAVAPPPAARSRSLYEVLRVGETATAVEIKAAYRSMAKLFHPDVAPAGEQGPDFLEIHRAYQTLSDPAERARYDVTIRRGCRPPAFSTAATAAAAAYDGLRTRRWETDQCW